MAKMTAPASLKKSEITRRVILEAAAKVFREKTYADARLSDIAAAAGIQTGSLYYHFSSRDDLVEQILVDGVDCVFLETVACVKALSPGTSPREKLSCAIRAHLESMLEASDFVGAAIRMIGQVPEALVSARRSQQRAYLDFWRKLFDEAAAAGLVRPGVDISVCRMLLMGLLNGSIEWFRKDGLSAAEIAEQASILLTNGILLPEVSKAKGRSCKKAPAKKQVVLHLARRQDPSPKSRAARGSTRQPARSKG